MSLAESPIRISSANASRTNLNNSKSCPSSLYAMCQDQTHEESLVTWSNDLQSRASRKLTSTMKLPEPVDSLGLTFEPRLCSSRLLTLAAQESRVHMSGVSTSECELATSEVRPDESTSGGVCCNSLDIADNCRKTSVNHGVLPRLPFGPQNKMIAMEVAGANSDSGINTCSVSMLEPTDMEGVEER